MEVKLERILSAVEAMEAKLQRLSIDSQRNERTVLFVEAFSEFEEPDPERKAWLQGLKIEMTKNLLGKPSERSLVTGPAENQEIRKAWQGLKIDRCAKISECVRKISSGRYKAIVVVDLDYEHKLFKKELGVVLQDFVRAGGVIAFFPLLDDGFLPVRILNRLFNTAWDPCLSSGNASWDVCNENYNTVTELFGDLSQLGGLPFPAGVIAVKNVPQDEQCFTLVKKMYRHDDSEEEDVYEKLVCVAVHRYGHGSIAFFGDANCRMETALLVAAYVRSRVSGLAPGQ